MASKQNENHSRARSDGCQYVADGNICGEKDSLAIIDEMQKMYEEKMNILDREGGGDYEILQAKNRLQGMWIKDLIEQSKMLIAAIQELEHEATERVRLLEQRIKNSTRSGNEVMNKYKELDISFTISETFQNMMFLQSDVHNLVEIIRRFREDGVWSMKDLHFYFVKSDDLLALDASHGSCEKNTSEPEMEEKLDKLKKEIEEKDLKIRELELTVFNLKTERGKKNEKEILELKKAMADMRYALTAEVTQKHEVILSLKKDIQQLEEQCRQADKQMIFKDDIIKEMRKDIKQLKVEAKPAALEERKRLEEDICRYKGQQNNLNAVIESLKCDSESKKRHRSGSNADECRKTYDTVLQEIIKRKKGSEDNISSDIECKCAESYETESLRSEKEALEKKLCAMEEEMKNLKKSHEKTLTQTCCEYDAKIRALTADYECYKKKFEETVYELEKMNKEKEKREEKIKELGCAIKECEEYQKKYEKGLAEIERINKEKEEHERKIRELECSMKGYEECKLKYAESLKELSALRKASELEERCLENQQDTLKRKAMDAINVNNALDEMYQCKLEEKMKEIEMLKQHIQKLEGKERRSRDSSPGDPCQRKISGQQMYECGEERIRELESDRYQRDREISNLKGVIRELEGGQVNARLTTDSLQSVINSYRESNNLLEESEKRLKFEISQQKLTINNLKEVLLSTKQELEELRQKAAKEIDYRKEIINDLYCDLVAAENSYLESFKKAEKYLLMLNNLKDLYLDLEVENFSYISDIEMLDSRLLKYQQTNKLNEESMKAAVKKMKVEKQEYENIIGYLKDEMCILSEQLQKLQQLLKIANSSNLDVENRTLTDNLIDAQAVNSVLQQQLKVAESQLSYEMKMNKHYITLIEELQDKLSSESIKNHRLEQKINETQYQLESANSLIRTLENTIGELENTVVLYEKDIDSFRQKEKQNENEIEVYQNQLKDLSTKLIDLEQKYKALEDELQEKVSSANEKEMKMMQEFTEKEVKMVQEFTEKEMKMMQEFTEKETKIMNEFAEKEMKITQDFREKEAKILHNFNEKDQETSQQLDVVRAEVDNLNCELTNMCHAQNMLKAENDKLKCQVGNYHNDRCALEQQLHQYKMDVEALQSAKLIVEEKYKKLKSQLQALQNGFDTLSKEYLNKAESLMNLEMELVDTKSSHTELCLESKKVVNNVRSWLEEQKSINERLEERLKTKDDVISKLKIELKRLKSNLNVSSKLTTSISPRHESALPLRQTPLSRTLHSCHPWSLGSQGSDSSYSSNVLDGEDETVSSDVETPTTGISQAWLYRVENMTEQLQRSNDYWRNKIHDYEYMVSRDQ